MHHSARTPPTHRLRRARLGAVAARTAAWIARAGSRHASLAATILAVLVLGGCSGYRLAGTVTSGGASDLLVGAAGAADADSSASALAGATIRVFRDPDRPSRALVATARSGDDGRFTLELDAFGAGWMDETWSVEAVAPGHVPVSRTLRLPRDPKGRRLVVVLAPGRGDDVRDPQDLRDLEDPWKTIERYR